MVTRRNQRPTATPSLGEDRAVHLGADLGASAPREAGPDPQAIVTALRATGASWLEVARVLQDNNLWQALPELEEAALVGIAEGLHAGVAGTWDQIIRMVGLRRIPAGIGGPSNFHLGMHSGFDLAGDSRLERVEALPRDSYDANYSLSGCANLEAVAMDHLEVHGILDLSACPKLTILPRSLRVGRNLDLSGCVNLRALPEVLQVGGTLDLRGCVRWNGKVPAGAQVQRIQTDDLPMGAPLAHHLAIQKRDEEIGRLRARIETLEGRLRPTGQG